MSERANSGSEFPFSPFVLSPAAAIFPKTQSSTVRAHRRGVLARDHASACQKEFALEQALRKAKTPKRSFVRNG
jgi:hypothetical protein